MKKELKEKWVAALRSGEYKQTRNFCLMERHDDGSMSYCCLGVLSEITKHNKSPGDRLSVYGDKFNYGVDVTEIWTRNDGMGDNSPHDFNQMADYIEEHVVED